MEYVLSELSERVATARAANRPVFIRGGGTRMFYGQPWPQDGAGAWLDLSAYHGVLNYQPSELVITARAGTRLDEIEQLLDAHGQMLAFEPPRYGEAGTLGGCVAAGLSGPGRLGAGPLSDFVLGTRLLDANGNVLRFGGEVMKNVAGYDVSRLLAGSLGILGALLEVSIKVLPKPRSQRTQVLQADEAQALAFAARWRRHPLPIGATAWISEPDGAGRLYVRLAGSEPAVAQAAERIGGEALSAGAAAALWRGLRDQRHPFFAERPLWRLSVPAGTPPLALGPTLHEWMGGLRWIVAEAAAAPALRARLAEAGGSATLFRHEGGDAQVPVFHPLAPAIQQIHRRIKQELDPAGLFNPHRLYPEF